MTPRELLDAFDVVAEAPNGCDRLRQLVLELAMHGRLVEQRASEGTGQELLLRIRGRAAESESVISRDTKFAIPESWTWARFGDLAETRLGKMLDKAKNRGTLRPYLRNANLQWFRFELDDIKQLRLTDEELEEYSLRVGDLVICEGGEPGRAAVCDESVAGMVFQKALHRARPRGGISSEFLAYLLRADTWSGRIQDLFTGATIKHLTGKALAVHPVPLPPLDEQARIVARADAFMALIDDFERARARREAAAAKLATALSNPAHWHSPQG